MVLKYRVAACIYLISCNDLYDKLCWTYPSVVLFGLDFGYLGFCSKFVMIGTTGCVDRTVMCCFLMYI